MKEFFVDLHVHSKYSRACSKQLDLEHLAACGAQKGLDIIASADITHPKWLSEIKEKLIEVTPGIFALKKGELAQEIVTTSYGYHIIKLVDQKSEKVKDAKGKTVDQEQVRASHILFSVKSSLDSFLNDLLSEALLKSNTRIYIKVHNPFEEAKKQTG